MPLLLVTDTLSIASVLLASLHRLPIYQLAGQIGQIISNANEAHSEFEKLMVFAYLLLKLCI